MAETPGRIIALALPLLSAAVLLGQGETGSDEIAATIAGTSAQSANTFNTSRILGVIPNYQTVSNPSADAPPLTALQKWELFVRESTDPFTIVTAGLGAAMSQAGNGMPRYGVGRAPLGQRIGAALADETSQSFFSDALLATVLHEDPRYFRKGPGSSVLSRIGYSLSRVAITRTDSGGQQVNLSCLIGTPLGIALSNAYYPPSSRTGTVMVSRLGTSFVSAALGNLLPEFWPDVRKRIFHRP